MWFEQGLGSRGYYTNFIPWKMIYNVDLFFQENAYGVLSIQLKKTALTWYLVQPFNNNLDWFIMPRLMILVHYIWNFCSVKLLLFTGYKLSFCRLGKPLRFVLNKKEHFESIVWWICTTTNIRIWIKLLFSKEFTNIQIHILFPIPRKLVTSKYST